MKKIILSGIAVVLIAMVVYVVSVINRAIQLDASADATWAQVDNQYQRRYDLIPNLLATVKGYAKHENETLNQVVAGRSQAMQIKVSLDNPADMQRYMQAQENLSGALSRLMAIAEAYPDLKANENFLSLQSSLEGTENRITVARQDYIAAVRSYNVMLRTIPSGWIIRKFTDLKPKATFTVAEPVRQAPRVSFE